MANDYYLGERYKGILHITWRDYLTPSPHLAGMKRDGWRVPTDKESSYLYGLRMMDLLGFSHMENQYGNYFIDPGVIDRFYHSSSRIRNFSSGLIHHSNGRELAMLRLVRSI